MSNVINGAGGGKHVVRTPLTTELINQAAPGLLQNSIDERIVKVRPMSTPIDQLSRCAASRACKSMTVEYYSVDTKKTETTVSEDFAGGIGTKKSDSLYTHILKTDDDAIFDVSETILVPAVTADASSGLPDGPLVLYVVSKPDTGGLEVAPAAGAVMNWAGGTGITTPAIPAGSKLIRMGRAATELDVQTAQFSALPRKDFNNCQIFKMQVEQSTMAKIARKEVGWNFSDQEEAAIIDMRLGMEKNFLFGRRAVMFDPAKNENIFLTGGIWYQTSRTFEADFSKFDDGTLIDICAMAFTGNAGSKRKILIAGTGLIEKLSKLSYTKNVSAGETFTKWGIEFKEIRSNFGSLYVIHSEIFDQCGHQDDGMILDPDYMTKYVHVPFHTEMLDLRRSGQRNTDAVVLTEASCLVLRYPDAHIRVVAK